MPVILEQSWTPTTAKSACKVVSELACSSNIFFLSFLAFQRPSPLPRLTFLKVSSRMRFQFLLYLISTCIHRKTFSRSFFPKEGLEIRFMDSDSWNEAENNFETSSAEKNFADEITWITWETKQNLEIWPFLNSLLEKWVWESGPKLIRLPA